MLKTRYSSSLAWEKSADVEEWIDACTDIGIDPGTFDAVTARLEHVRDIEQRKARFSSDANSGTQQARTRIAAEALDYDSTVILALTAVAGATEEQRDAVIDLLGRAANDVYRQVFSQFRKLGTTLKAELRKRHDDLIPRLIAVADQIPAGTQTLEVAARHGAGEAWLAAERAYNDWTRLHELHWDWLLAGIVPNKGRRPVSKYLPVELRFRDLDAVRQVVRVRGAEHLWLAEVAQHAEPGVLDLAEVDSLRTVRPDFDTREGRTEASQARRKHAEDTAAASKRLDRKSA